MKRALLAILAGALILPLASARVGAQAPSLKFFKPHFITGDYVVAGTSLWRRGNGVALASGQITVPVGEGAGQVPAGVDILAAYLYVQTAEVVQWSGIDHATFNGFDLGPGTNSYFKALNWDQATRPCWSVAWPGGRRMVTYRADVLRFLPLAAPPADPEHDLTQPLTIEVPDSGLAFPDLDEIGTENPAFTGPRAIGASLVILYGDPRKPLRSVVIYDGGVTKTAFATMGMTLSGFDQASLTAPGARLTPIVGDGRPFLSERLRVNGTLIATNPFRSGAGAKWDNPTYNVPVVPGSAAAALEISPDGLLSDCVSLSAVVFSTAVQDMDGDGHLDRWETSTVASPVLDPYGRPKPPLGSMGAINGVRDLFMEVGYFNTDGFTDNNDASDDPTMNYGGEPKPGHSHRPGHEALKIMGDALWNAPTEAQRIRVHFDMGPGYDGGSIPDCVAGHDAPGACIIRGPGLARGGEVIPESFTQCTPTEGAPPWECQFSQYPGTVGWKTGFQYMRDQILSPTPPEPVPPGFFDACDDPFSTGYSSCVRRFDPNRMHTFHYALFAHAVGLPKAEEPCLNGTAEVPGDSNGACAPPLVFNPKFLEPRTNTGLGDFPGGDILVSMGGFNDIDGLPVGTPFEQASTLTHEFGHNALRRHGGEAFEPNCRPTYLSVMNYMYQLRGQSDDAGNRILDFSREVGATVNEDGLNDLAGNFKRYRIGWFAPLAGSYLDGQPGVQAARAHCNGSPLLPGDVPMVRLDARQADGTGGAAINYPIDWDGDGDPGTVALSQDVNFSGALAQQYPAAGAAADWDRLDLRQVGGRRSSGGTYTDSDGTTLALGPLSIMSGKGDAGKGDAGKGDAGKGDAGKGDAGKGDAGKGDAGGALGKGDAGKGDAGGGDNFDSNDPALASGELDATLAAYHGVAAPNPFVAAVIDEAGANFNDVQVTFTAANGDALRFQVYRVVGTDVGLENDWIPVGPVIPFVQGQLDYSIIDSTPLVGTSTYFAVATYPDLTTEIILTDTVNSEPSARSTVEVVNDPPVANGQEVTTNEDTAKAITLGATDLEGAPLTYTVLSGPTHGALSGEAPNLTYTPALNYNGPDSFTFKVNDGSVDSNEATVNITVNPVNDPPTGVGDTYNTPEDTQLAVAAPGVLGNDNDVDGDTLTALLVPYSGPSHGTLALAPDGSFVYTPAPNYSGPDSFKYRAYDGPASTGEIVVTLTITAVNDAPVANPQTVTTNEDTAKAFVLTGIDTEGSPLTFSVVTPPTHGALSGTAPNLTYTPALNYNGPDSFTFKVNDGGLDSAPATVGISVTAINDAPVAVNDTYTMVQGTSLTVPLPGVLGNDTDAEGSALTALLVTGPANCTFTLNANGSFTLTPAANFTGNVTFTYKAKDGALFSNVATVTITVTPGPYSGIYNVENLPPPSGAKFSRNSWVTFRWNFKRNNQVVASQDAKPLVTIVGPPGFTTTTFKPGALCVLPNCGEFQYYSSFKKWLFKWKPGAGAPTGFYYVYVGSELTNQTFPAAPASPPVNGYKVEVKP